MKFGGMEHPELIDSTLPAHHPESLRVLKTGKRTEFKHRCSCGSGLRVQDLFCYQTMKKLTLSLLIVGYSVFTSCSENESTPSNDIIIDGESIPLVNGYYFDIESATSAAGRVQHGTHYSQAFFLTDGTVSESAGELVCNNCTFEVFIDANSAGKESFSSDNFNSEKDDGLPLSSTAAESYFFLTAEATDGSLHYASNAGGTISVDVNTPIFAFDFDFPALDETNSSEVAISGRFKGEFEELDASLLGADH
ncbi:MAG: hypothetical protein GY816_12215 [Cytophagales bacterium]|nr:hypothetical protein [Cytophagales bacterium]